MFFKKKQVIDKYILEKIELVKTLYNEIIKLETYNITGKQTSDDVNEFDKWGYDIDEILTLFLDNQPESKNLLETWNFCLEEVLDIGTTLNEDLYLKSYVLKVLMREYSFLVDKYIEQK